MRKLLLVLLALPFFAFAQHNRSISYGDAGQALEGYYVSPEKALPGQPGVLILPAWMGITPHEKKVAEELAGKGYRVFIGDIYGVGNYPANTTEAGAIASRFKQDYKSYQKRIKLALDELVRLGPATSRIAAIGYCFGGTGVLEMARAQMPVKAVISVHGGLGKDASRKDAPIKCAVLALHGADDPFVKPAEITAFQAEMRHGNADWQLVSYGNAVHAFSEVSAGTDNTKGAAYNALADRRSKEAIYDFLREFLSE